MWFPRHRCRNKAYYCEIGKRSKKHIVLITYQSFIGLLKSFLGVIATAY